MSKSGLTASLVCLVTGAATISPGAAQWCDLPLAQWSEAPCLQGSDTERPPYGTWAEQDDVVVAEGRSRFWSQMLMPGDQGDSTRITVGFSVETSSGQTRQLPGGCQRWGFHWGENLPGWDVGVVLRWKDPLNFYRVQLSASRGELALWDSTGGFLQLIPCEVELGKHHTLEITACGPSFDAVLDGEEVMQYWDRTLPHSGGQVGLAVWQSTVRSDQFELEQLPQVVMPLPPHKPDFRLETTDGIVLGHPAFGLETCEGVILFDGREPIGHYWRQGSDPKYKGNREALFFEAVKLRPGWRPAYYTWVGPNINHRVLPLVGDLPGALKIEEQGDRLAFRFALGEDKLARAEEVCTVTYDADRGVYRYEYGVHTQFTFEEPTAVYYFELTDPLTYNNRSPGPEVVHRWNPAGHKWHVFQGPGPRWERYPLIDYLTPEYNNLPTHWGKFASFLYPDPAACPAFELDLGWEQNVEAGSEFRLGLCHWGYDFHQKEEGAHVELPVGTVRDYSVAFTGLPMKEGQPVFEQSVVAPKVAASTDRYGVFDPSATSFETTSVRSDPAATMVWQHGEVDDTVGREDSHSLRIDGPGKAEVQVYQYAIEQFAERWWLHGWVKSKGVRGRGLQLRVKYSYGPEPEEVFYTGGLGDRDWTRFSFVTDVPKRRDSTTVSLELDGPGQVWLDDVAFSALPDDRTPETTEFEVPPGLEPREGIVIDLAMSEEPLKAVYDESRNGHALYLQGATWMREQGRGFLRFDGVDDAGILPIKPILEPLQGAIDDTNQRTVFPLKQFSYEFWLRPREPAEGQTRMTVFHFRRYPRVWLDKANVQPGELRMVYLNQAYRAEEIKFEQTMGCDEWVHVVATHGDGQVVLYVNGEKAQEAAYDKDAMGFEFFAYTWQYHVGAWYARQDYLNGDLGPLRLHTGALTAAQVAELCQSGWPTVEDR